MLPANTQVLVENKATVQNQVLLRDEMAVNFREQNYNAWTGIHLKVVCTYNLILIEQVHSTNWTQCEKQLVVHKKHCLVTLHAH